MQIDWFTVSAQIVNFLILIYLLKRFLYQPVLQTMKLRAENIANQQFQAKEKMRSADHLALHYQEKRKALESQQSDFLNHARLEAENQRTVLLDQLRREIDQKRSAWLNELSREQASTMLDIKTLINKKILQISRHVLRDLAGTELEQQMICRFIEQLTQLSEEETRFLTDAMMSDEKVTVATSFTVDQAQIRAIKDSISRIQPGLIVQFKRRPEIICGILLETSGKVWPWNVEKVLDGLEEAFAELITPSESINHAESNAN